MTAFEAGFRSELSKAAAPTRALTGPWGQVNKRDYPRMFGEALDWLVHKGRKNPMIPIAAGATLSAGVGAGSHELGRHVQGDSTESSFSQDHPFLSAFTLGPGYAMGRAAKRLDNLGGPQRGLDLPGPGVSAFTRGATALMPFPISALPRALDGVGVNELRETADKRQKRRGKTSPS